MVQLPPAAWHTPARQQPPLVQVELGQQGSPGPPHFWQVFCAEQVVPAEQVGVEPSLAQQGWPAPPQLRQVPSWQRWPGSAQLALAPLPQQA